MKIHISTKSHNSQPRCITHGYLCTEGQSNHIYKAKPAGEMTLIKRKINNTIPRKKKHFVKRK